jgi:hypothetical protein
MLDSTLARQMRTLAHTYCVAVALALLAKAPNADWMRRMHDCAAHRISGNRMSCTAGACQHCHMHGCSDTVLSKHTLLGRSGTQPLSQRLWDS